MNSMQRLNQKCQKKPKGCRAEALISVANNSSNPLLQIDRKYHSFKENDLNLILSCHQWSDVDEECHQWVIQLIEDNMKQYYESSAWGWNPSNKLKELRHKTCRLLLLRCVESNQLIGFVHFRFESGGNDSEPVIYCYELQVIESHQRLGIGRYLMSCLNQIGLTFHMNKVMLTVFKKNLIANDFYIKSLKYRIDRSSPSRFQTVADYEILCLKIDNK